MIKITPAVAKDKLLLWPFFQHYDLKTAAARLDCYLTHNHTVVAKNNHQIVGILQWHIKEVVKYFASIGKNPRKIYLFVSQENSIARHLYEKFGFKSTANLKDIFSKDEDELFYTLDISK